LQRLAQLIQQPRVLNGNDGLRGEVLNQLDLLVGEGSDFLPVEDERTDEPFVLKHRHIEKSAGTGGFDQPNHPGIPFGIGAFSSKVGYVDCFFGGSHASKRIMRVLTQHMRLSDGMPSRIAIRRQRAKCTVAKAEHDAELGLADPHRIFQHSIEHRLKFAGRT
jgi:hypothetical protein